MMMKRLSWLRLLGGFLLMLVGQILAQSAGLLIGDGLAQWGLPVAAAYLVAGALYVALMALVIGLLCRFYLHVRAADLRVLPLRFSPFWAVAAVMMPLTVVVLSVISGGSWVMGDMTNAERIVTVAAAVAIPGIATGFAEEALFRGYLLATLEQRVGRTMAIIAPSVIFACMHLIGRPMDLLSFLQLLVAGSLVGILFSLVTLETGSIYSSALMHAVWNIVLISDIVNISSEASDMAIASFVLKSDSPLFTGGDFGIEASLMGITAMAVFTVLALLRRKRKIQ